MPTEVQWDTAELDRGFTNYYQTALQALHAIAEYYAPIVESEAKTGAPWTDRTGNARQGLQGLVEDLSETTVVLYLMHGEPYGIFLELRNQGRYAIILSTLEAKYGEIGQMLQQVFGK